MRGQCLITTTCTGSSSEIWLQNKWVSQTSYLILHILFLALNLRPASNSGTVPSLQDSTLQCHLSSRTHHFLSAPVPLWNCGGRHQWEPACHVCMHQGHILACTFCSPACCHVCLCVCMNMHGEKETSIQNEGWELFNECLSFVFHGRFCEVFYTFLRKTSGGTELKLLTAMVKTQ